MIQKMDNVTSLGSYCTMCGNCLAVCPRNALMAVDDAIKANANCISCRSCIRNCPGYEFDFPQFNKSIFGSFNNAYSPFLGYYQELKIGRCLNKAKKASSGGLVSALLASAMENKLVDGVIVIDFDKGFKPVAKVVRTKNGILRAAGSKYSVVPVNEVLKTFRKGENYAFVGLPCHIHGIRLLQKNNFAPASQIKFCVGLFCGRTMHSCATKFIIKKLKCYPQNIIDISYRGGAWPGGFRVQEFNGKKYFLHKRYYDLFNLMFNPKRCLACPDYTSEFADVSVGDCWIKGKEAYSTVIVRTPKGKQLFSAAKNLECFNISLRDIVKTHPNFSYKQGASLRGRWLGIIPKYNLSKASCSYPKTMVFYMVIRLLMSGLSRRIVAKLPIKFIGMLVYLRRAL